MDFFLDTADINDIKPLIATGLIKGVTTNPTLIAKNGGNFEQVIVEICDLVKGPVSAEVVADQAQDMITEGKKLAQLNGHIVIKLPITLEGLKACYAMSEEGIATNMTLCFSLSQALMAANAGARFVSPFVGRLDDIGQSGSSLVRDIVDTFQMYALDTMVLAASLRTPQHVMDAALCGADCATIPPKLMYQLIEHPLTDKGLDIFNRDWQQYKR
ncbi:MAG: fructose-6-phosphate aldolase [Alphaproteobacteria bacterium]|nr:fructose-6-phosphate aldolase [Alphaproteobacteria bacterium]